jgi:hypothetical protein
VNSEPVRCICAECTDLDQLPERLQGIPGAVQLKMPLEKKRKRRKSPTKSKT